jgi:hypothetical protein
MSTPVVSPYASEVVSGWNIWKPEKMFKLFQKNGQQGMNLFMMMMAFGQVNATALNQYSHYEDRLINQVITVKANVPQPAIGANITFALGSDSLEDGRYYVRQWDKITFNGGRPNSCDGSVVSIALASGDVNVTVELSDKTRQFPALTADQQLPIHGNAFSEGSGQPQGRVRGADEIYNQVEIIKETISATGTEMTNQTWINVTEDGSKVGAWYNLGLLDGEYRMTLAESAGLMHHNLNNGAPIIDPDTNRPVLSTEGLIPHAFSNAFLIPKASGTFAEGDLKTIDRYMRKQFVDSQNIAGMSGAERYYGWQDFMNDTFPGKDFEAVTRDFNTMISQGNAALAGTLSWGCVTYANRTYGMNEMPEWNNPTVNNYEGSKIPELLFFMPTGTSKDADGVKRNYFGMRYKAFEGYSRQKELWTQGTAGTGVRIGDKDARSWYWRSNIGGQWFKSNQWCMMHAND